MQVRFNPKSVDHALRVISALRHTKGRWAGKPLKLTNVQIAYIVAPLFGWQVYDDSLGRWLRLYRDAYIEMPRKGAKSTLASALAMVLASVTTKAVLRLLLVQRHEIRLGRALHR